MEMSERDEARFWSKVALPDGEGCMLWMANRDAGGYGRFRLLGRNASAHRVSYELAYSPIPEGLHIDHVRSRGCTNRHCVAPLHLEAVTQAENNRREDAAKTHCPRGHPYAGSHLVIYDDGRRRCRTCRNAQQRAAYWERKEASCR